MALTNEKSTPVPDAQALVACRVCLCLATGKMYCFETTDAELKREFFNITGLEVSPGDGLPQHICHICRRLLRKATEFRNKCHSTHKLLSSHPVTLEFIQNIHILHGQPLQNTDVVSANFDSNSVGVQSDIDSDSGNCLNNDKEDLDSDFLNSPDDADSKWATKNYLNSNQNDDDFTTMVDENAKNSIPIVETKSLKFTQNMHSQSLQNTDIVCVTFDSNSVDLQLGAKGDTQNHLNKEETEENDKYFQSGVRNDLNKEYPESNVLNSHEDTDSEWATDDNLNDNDQSDNDFIPEQDDEFDSMVEKVVDETEDCIPFGEIKSEETEADTMDMQSNDTIVEYNKMLHEYMQVKYVSKTLTHDSLKLGCSKRKLYNYMRAKYNYEDKDEEKEEKRNISLKNTIFLHAKKYNFKVEYFSNKVEQIENLRARMDTHKYKVSKFKCTDCYIGFQNEHKYKKHRTRHDSAIHGHYKCEVCKLRYHNKTTLRSHTRLHKNKYICNQCGMSFMPVNPAKLQEHFKSHNGGSKYKCEYCPHVVSKKATLLHHVYRNHGTVPCGICHFMMLPNGVDRHMIRQHAKTFTCSSCNKVFNDYAAIATHIHTSPNGVCGADAWPCTKCGENFSEESDLRGHVVQCRRRLTPQQREDARVRAARFTTPAGIVCEWCAKISPSPSHYRIHVRIHTGERPFACPECPKACRTKGNLQKHMRVHTGALKHQNQPSEAGRKKRRTFTCSSCNKVFSDYAAIATHIHTSPDGVCGADAWPCTKCGENFNTESDLRGHVSGCRRRNINEAGPKKTTKKKRGRPKKWPKIIVCEWCAKTFSNPSVYRKHEMMHTDERPHACPECPKMFRTKATLRHHMTMHTDERPHACSECPKAFRSKRDLRLHMMRHTGERPHACPECPKAFRTTKDLKQHMPIHTGERAYQCPQCENAFTTEPGLWSHRRTVHENLRQHECTICSKKFHTAHNLKRHMNTVHKNELPHDIQRKIKEKQEMQKNLICEWCAKKFYSRSELRRHVMMHTDERPHACPECPKMFRSKKELKQHMAVHTGERKHQCSQCGNAFTCKSSLRSHRRIVHENIRRHECPICSKKFGQSSDLKKHLNTVHENQEEKKQHKERPHQCSQCEKAYTAYPALYLHRKTVHENLRPHECTICSKKFSQSSHLRTHLNTVHKNELPHDIMEARRVGRPKKAGSEVKKVGRGVKKVGRGVKKLGTKVKKGAI